jgi:acyl-CoA reductase-like NAD-dependent aldehyde dehydrogenase
MEHVRLRLQDVAERLEAGSGWVNTFPDTGPEAQVGVSRSRGLGLSLGLWAC